MRQDADATPRRARGVVRKPESNVVRHIERGDSSHKPRVSKVRAARIKEAAQELTAEAECRAKKRRGRSCAKAGKQRYRTVARDILRIKNRRFAALMLDHAACRAVW